MKKRQSIKIFLIGMMGSGKTTVGKILSKNLNLNLIDLDKELEKITNHSIKDIFNEYGEKKFRKMESSYFIEINKTIKNCIFATSGGIILNQECSDLLKNERLTFLLDTSTEVLYERLKGNSSRPLIPKEQNSYKIICDLWKSRKQVYNESSNYKIQTDNLSPKEVARSIKKVIHQNN